MRSQRVLIVSHPSTETGMVRDCESGLRGAGFVTERFRLDERIENLVTTIARFKPDAIFNLCERVHGDPLQEKNAAAIYEVLRVPFTGNSVMALGICQRKDMAKRLLASEKIPTPAFVTMSPGRFEKVTFKLPAIVKPTHEDGSLGITRRSYVTTEEALRERVDYVHRKFQQPALCEQFIDGREIQVSLIGNDNPRVLAVAELSYAGLPGHLPKICSFSAKWQPETVYHKYTNPIVPAQIPKALEARIRDVALRVFRLFELRGYARIDMRVKNGRPYVIDVNPNPDISMDAGYARAGLCAKMTYSELMKAIVDCALEITPAPKYDDAPFAPSPLRVPVSPRHTTHLPMVAL